MNKSSNFIEFTTSKLFVSAEYKHNLGSNDTGKVILQQTDGRELIIYDVTWFDWTILYFHTRDEEVDGLKKKHLFDYKK